MSFNGAARSIRILVAPSTVAASSSSAGIARMNGRRITIVPAQVLAIGSSMGGLVSALED